MADLLEKILLGDETFSNKMNALIAAIKEQSSGVKTYTKSVTKNATGDKITIVNVINGTEQAPFDFTGGGGTGEPAAYLKSVTINAGKATFKKKDDTDEVFEPVKSNPTLVGTENTLSSLDIGGTKFKLDYIKLLGNEQYSGQPYHFPYHFTAAVDNSGNLGIHLYTITLDNNKTKTEYDSSLPLFEDSVIKSDINKGASLKTAKFLNDRINNISTVGRFLSLINCLDKLVSTMPSTISTTAYEYKAGDYFIVNKSGGYKPKNGVSSIAIGSTNIEWEATSEVAAVGDVWKYDGTNWILQPNYNHVDFSVIEGEPLNNTKLSVEFGKKLDKVTTSGVVYATKTEGTSVVQTTIGYSLAGSTNNTLVLRDNAGRIQVGNILGSESSINALAVNYKYLWDNIKVQETLAGTEALLTELTVKGTKYKIADLNYEVLA